MTFLLAALAALAGQETPAADALRALGAEVTETGGVIVRVAFKDCSKLGEAEFRRIGAIKGLKSLTLYGGKKALNDATLPLLAGLSELEELNTEGIHVSDAGLAGFAALRNLKALAFFHPSLDLPGFDGSGFAALKALPRLERLTVAGSRFNDKGMEALAELKQLRELRTWHTYQTQAGNAAFEKLPELRTLRLGQRLRRWDGGSNACSLDDATLGVFSRLTTLESLTLDEARLSLDALLKLKSLPRLRKLELLRIDIAAEDVARLKSALPEVQVEWKPLTDEERTKLEAYLKP
jgi:hypothetical protein